jgi:hypothetical protein
MIRGMENGWEQYVVLICAACQHRLHWPGSADFALMVLTQGSCGHPYPGYA